MTERKWRKIVRKAQKLRFPNTVNCNLDPVKFQKDFILKSKTAIMTNCSAAWPAQSRWSFKGLLGLAEGQKQWRTNFVDRTGRVADKEEQGQLQWGHQVLKMVRENITVRVFDPLAEHEHKAKRGRGEDSSTNKLSLQEDYSTPAVLSRDLLRECGQLTDYQWTFLSSPRTGTDLHLDPPLTSAWNTVLEGSKLWTILPPGVEPSLLQCDPSCSGSGDEISPLSWFTHILPQLKGRRWYGKGVQEVTLLLL